MKAMKPEHFWALAQHLQKCNHCIYVDNEDDTHIYIRLSTGDTLHHDDERTPNNLHSVRLALLELEARKLTRFEIRTPHTCPPTQYFPSSG